MATAPRPGASQAKRQGVRLTAGGRVFELELGDLTAEDAHWIRRETDFSLNHIVLTEQFDLDSVAALWLLCRRKEGERKLRFRQVLKEMPAYALAFDEDEPFFIIEALESDDAEDDLDLDDDDQEAADAAPLPSAADSGG